jgi:hypothetical protein
VFAKGLQGRNLLPGLLRMKVIQAREMEFNRLARFLRDWQPQLGPKLKTELADINISPGRKFGP